MDRPWFAHYDPGVPHHLEYPAITLPQLFREAAEGAPDVAATIFQGKTLTYAQLDQRIDAFAGSLQKLGVRPGERVALMLPNLPQFLIGFFGVLRAGALVVPTNPLYMQKELEHQLTDAGASAIITLDQLFGKVQAALPATGIRAVIVTGVDEALPRHLRPLYNLMQRRSGLHHVRSGGVVYRFAELLRSSDLPKPSTAQPHDVAVLQYTGGTTGLSKGAMLTHRNLIANALQARSWQGDLSDGSQIKVLCAIPFFHVYGLTVAMNMAVAARATMILIPRWVPRDVAKAARKHRPQIFPGVPPMYVALPDTTSSPARDFASLKVCMSGAAPLLPQVQRRFEEVSGSRVVEGYGLTEAGPITHCNPLIAHRRNGTVGVPFPDTDAVITDPETWKPVAVGTVGELTVRGPQVMKGYWNRPEETLAILRAGWLHTGDIATMDDDGFFRIVDRKKDVIITNGYNVYPREVEETLHGHPAVKEAAVVGVHSAHRGEIVKAFVVLQDGEVTTQEEIIAFCRVVLSAYKVPKVIEFRDELPKSLTGKVIRRELREGGASLSGSDEERPVA